MKKKVVIGGMSCAHCTRHVSNALSELAGVTRVDVSLEEKYALIEGDHETDDQAVRDAIQEAGYEVFEIIPM